MSASATASPFGDQGSRVKGERRWCLLFVLVRKRVEKATHPKAAVVISVCVLLSLSQQQLCALAWPMQPLVRRCDKRVLTDPIKVRGKRGRTCGERKGRKGKKKKKACIRSNGACMPLWQCEVMGVAVHGVRHHPASRRTAAWVSGRLSAALAAARWLIAAATDCASSSSTPHSLSPLSFFSPTKHQQKMAGLEGAFLTLCNPLLDISSVVDQAFLDKYQVRPQAPGDASAWPVWCPSSASSGNHQFAAADQAGQPDPR